MAGLHDDQKLLRRIAEGDSTAIQALFARYHVRIYRFIVRQLGNEAVAEELANEVFLDVWRQAGRFEGKSTVSTWMMAIARYKAISFLRKRQLEVQDLGSGEDGEAMQYADDADTPETTAQKSDKAAAIRKAVEALSVDHRAVIDLAYYHEKSVREVAEILDIPQNTVKTRMFHARKKLAVILKQAGIDRGWP